MFVSPLGFFSINFPNFLKLKNFAQNFCQKFSYEIIFKEKFLGVSFQADQVKKCFEDYNLCETLGPLVAAPDAGRHWAAAAETLRMPSPEAQALPGAQ